MSPQQLSEVLRYYPETGHFYWKVWSPNTPTDRLAGTVSVHGRRVITYKGKKHYASRLAWALTHGDWPRHEIDHIDGDQLNDAIKNLRDVPRQTNQQNAKQCRADRRPLGIQPNGDGWMARLNLGAETVYLGTRPKMWQAGLLYLRAKRKMHAGNTL